MQLDCAEVILELSNYIDDELSIEMRAAIEAHLVSCDRCIAIYDSVRNVLLLINSWGKSIELPAGFSARLYQKLQSER
jgi:predicted anti-sigma-YlaC factor YlaD